MSYKTPEDRRRAVKARQDRLRAQHRCIYCGATDERTLAGKCYCTACAERIQANEKARHAYLRAVHKCVICGARDERTLAGAALCVSCAAKHDQRMARWRKNKKEADANGKHTD